jgi:hypothetical protein
VGIVAHSEGDTGLAHFRELYATKREERDGEYVRELYSLPGREHPYQVDGNRSIVDRHPMPGVIAAAIVWVIVDQSELGVSAKGFRGGERIYVLGDLHTGFE